MKLQELQFLVAKHKCMPELMGHEEVSVTCRHVGATGAMDGPKKPMSRMTAFIKYSFSLLSGCLQPHSHMQAR